MLPKTFGLQNLYFKNNSDATIISENIDWTKISKIIDIIKTYFVSIKQQKNQA